MDICTEPRKVQLLGIEIQDYSLDALIKHILKKNNSENIRYITYGNINTFNLALKNNWFKTFLQNDVDTLFCDGKGVQLGVRVLTGEKIERNTPPDWFDQFCEHCVTKGSSLFVISSSEHVIQKTEVMLNDRFPGLNLVGLHHGFFDKNKNSSENQEVVQMIRTANPDVLILGLGMPLQEKWYLENREDLPSCTVLSVGAMFDFLVHETRRAPRWMTDAGFEWLGRLITEPGRLWKRYIVGIPTFYFHVLRQKLGAKYV